MGFLAILTGVAVTVFFLLVVPWMAIAARRDARVARAAAEVLKLRVDQLFHEVEELRSAPAAAADAALAPPEAARDVARKGRAAARLAETPAVQATVAAAVPAEAAAGKTEQPFASPWKPAAAAEGLMRDGAAQLAPVSGPDPEAAQKRDLEEVIGTRWAIWVGGLALALGSLFLVRYTIEAGLLGPAARLVLGYLFSLALIGAGEALRRGLLLPRLGDAKLPVEHAPLALTAAGTVGLFGVVYAAHALYGYIPQAAAFVLLGLIGAAAMAASVLHGQALAGLGLIGSYATPLLIGGENRNRWPLVIFLLIVTATGLAVQHKIRTIWLGWAVIAGVAVWTFLLIAAQIMPAAAELTFILDALVLFAGAFLIAARPRYALSPAGDPMPLAALSGLLAAIGLSFVSHPGDPTLHAMAAIAGSILVAASVVRDGRAGLAIIAAALLPLGMILTWPSEAGKFPVYVRVVAGALAIATDPPRASAVLTVFALLSAAAMALAPLALFLRRIAPVTPHSRPVLVALALVGGLSAPVLVFAWALRVGGLAQNLTGAAIITAVVAGLAYLTRYLIALSVGPAAELVERRQLRVAAGGYGAGAALALGLAIALALPGLWMAVGFAVAAVAVAWLNDRQPLPMLRRVAAAFATTAILRAVLSPVFQKEGAWPVLNSYIVAYALPAVLLAAAAWFLAKCKRDRAVKTTLACAGLMGAIYLAFTIRHGFHGFDLVDSFRVGLGESGLYAVACLLAALGLFVVRERVGAEDTVGLRRVMQGVNVLGVVITGLLSLLLANPWLGGRILGFPVVDSSFVGFVLPALAMGALAYHGRTKPGWFPNWLTTANRNLAIALGYLFALAQTRIVFVGMERFARAYSGQGEQYAYSAVTLVFGVLLLVIGFRLGSRPTRLASAAFVTLAVLKVFLFDLSELEGLLRALSFIGLGAVLIGIGLAYQRLLFDRKPSPQEPQAAAA